MKFVTAGGLAQVMTGAVAREIFLKPVWERVRIAAFKLANRGKRMKIVVLIARILFGLIFLYSG